MVGWPRIAIIDGRTPLARLTPGTVEKASVGWATFETIEGASNLTEKYK